jgi:tetratricopeptide (TPR) repeat protein
VSESSSLRSEPRTFAVADLGDENPLPMVGPPLETPYRITGAVPEAIIAGSRYGNPDNLYPYQEQANYGRELHERPLRTVVLDNEHLRAVFLPELGGRLWALVDKDAQKQLVHTGDAIQFANLALRNAWFAGGIEWNIGTRGHSPTTCSPVHAALVHADDGQQVLRMWEFERLREVVFQVDAWLPAHSRVLLVSIRIRNPNHHPVPMYWWTNAAVPQSELLRVVAPADTAFASDYTEGIARATPTDDGGVDCTWPARNRRARDFFFDLAPETRPWILAADTDGDGLAMLSTATLRGRKLFVWGEGPGGHRWQEWLTPAGTRYAEIQAGLAQTQFEHLEMPAGAEWSWVEAYGNARVQPDLAHSADWGTAVRHCASRADELLSAGDLDAALDYARSWADAPPTRSLSAGTGWGALESVRRERSGMPWIRESGTPFAADTITADQKPWRDLLEGPGAAFAGSSTFVRGDDWEALLEAQHVSPAVLWHLAVMAHARGNHRVARVRYLELLALASAEPTLAAAAHRGLALISLAEGRVPDALERYRQACALDRHNVSLLVEAVTALVRHDAADQALPLIDSAGPLATRAGRIRFLWAQALAGAGHRNRAAKILEQDLEVPDLREGEDSLAQLWAQVSPGVEVPGRYQFGMT